MDRRAFLKHHGLLALDFDWQQKPAVTHQGLAVLANNNAGLFFLGNDHKKVNLANLQAESRGHASTLCFMFTPSECGRTGSSICPNTAAALEAASQKDPSLHHFIVSVSPKSDISGPRSGNLQTQLDYYPHLKGHYTVLYPVTATGYDTDHHAYAYGTMLDGLQTKFNLIHGGSDATLHSGSVLVYDASGRQLGDAVTQLGGPNAMAAEINRRSYVAPARQKAAQRQ